MHPITGSGKKNNSISYGLELVGSGGVGLRWRSVAAGALPGGGGAQKVFEGVSTGSGAGQVIDGAQPAGWKRQSRREGKVAAPRRELWLPPAVVTRNRGEERISLDGPSPKT